MHHGFRPASPTMECNTRPSKNSGCLVYPTKELTETKIATCARPTYFIMPCATCKRNADQKRESIRAEHPGLIDGSHMPYMAVTGSSKKKNKLMKVPVKRVSPNPEQHAMPGPAPIRRVRPGVHNPYVPACQDGACSGLCFEGICNGDVPWNGECTGHEICKTLGSERCICKFTEAVPKHMIACLDWTNRGQCDPTKRGLNKCAFAHPDLTSVHPDVCCNFLLTGVCRFHNSGPDPCPDCHCTTPKDGVYPLLPGLTKKILRQNKKTAEWDCTGLDRALVPYKAFLGYE